jgi:hypothetical protein
MSAVEWNASMQGNSAVADAAAALEVAPYPFLLLSTDLTIIGVNAIYLYPAEIVSR